MDLTVSNYKQVVSKELIKTAKKCSVRECDEIGQGQFQAYVDENKESFDVNINLGKTGIVTDHSCDCDVEDAICQHRIALLLFIADRKTEKKLPVNKKKVDRIDVLLNELKVDELKVWIKDLLMKNKDLELSFIHQFSHRSEGQTPEDIKRLTLESVKAVLSSRKKAEAGEVKKIVSLWSEIHEPVIEAYCADLANEDAFLKFNALAEACEETRQKINAPGNRLYKYLDDQFSRVASFINALEKNDEWIASLAHFVSLINKDVKHLRVSHLLLLVKTLHAPAEGKLIDLIDELMKAYKASVPEKMDNWDVYTAGLFAIVTNSELFDRYYQHFKPIPYNNNFNESLITLLINKGHFNLAARYCEEQIKLNSKEEYDIPYLQLLKHIYTVEKKEKKLAAVLMQLFPLTYNFDDYIFIYKGIQQEDERKKWRSKVLTRARHTSYNPYAINFVFRLADSERNYKKMIEYINEQTPYPLIAEFAEKMILTDKKAFLLTILRAGASFYKVDEDQNGDAIPRLYSVLNKYYTNAEIKYVLDERKGYYSSSPLVVYVKKRMAL